MPEYATDPVTVHVKSCSICGSDLHLLSWGLPCTVGHEFAGLLDDGTPVAVQPYVPCGVCDQCLDGQTARCRVWLERFHGVSIDGGLADEVIVDRACLAVLPPEVPIENAALTEPLAVVVRAANNAGLTGAGDGDGPVLVIGAGSIGLAMTAVLRHRGYEVDVMARHDSQRAAAERLGAGFTPIAEYSVVVDAAGTQAAVDEAVARLAPGATLAVVSTWWDPVQLGFGLLSKEATVVPVVDLRAAQRSARVRRRGRRARREPGDRRRARDAPLRARRRARGVRHRRPTAPPARSRSSSSRDAGSRLVPALS